MIKLDIREYCQACTEFEPRVTQRPEQLNRDFGGDLCFYGDTIVECEHLRHCEAIYNYLKRSDNDV